MVSCINQLDIDELWTRREDGGGMQAVLQVDVPDLAVPQQAYSQV